MLGVSVLFYGNWPKWVGGVGGPYSGAYPCAAPCIWTTSANVSLLAAAGALAMQVRCEIRVHRYRCAGNRRCRQGAACSPCTTCTPSGRRTP